MPWPENHIPKYRKSGQTVVTIAGKDHYLGPHGTKASKLLYDRLVAEWLGGGRIAPTEPGDESLTVATLLSDYLTFAEGYYVKNGRRTSKTPSAQ